jgi:hypothetical protein
MELIEGVTRRGIVVGFEVQLVVKEWLEGLTLPYRSTFSSVPTPTYS